MGSLGRKDAGSARVIARIVRHPSMDRARYNAEAARVIDDHIESLRKMTFQEAAALPETSSEDRIIAGEKASVSIFRQDSPYQLEDKILVVVLVARERWFGMTAYHIERGLVFLQAKKLGKQQRSSFRTQEDEAMPNKCIKFALTTRPTRKGDAPLLAAHR
jgi:hypothetical protein